MAERAVQMLVAPVVAYSWVVNRQGTAVEVTGRVKIRSGAWPSEDASADGEANGSFVEVKGRKYVCFAGCVCY